MLEELKLLEELQRVDLQVLEWEQSLRDLPAKIQALKDDVASVEALLERERKQLREVQTYVAELSASLTNDRDQQARAKAKMAQVRNSREYMAVQREFEANRRTIGDREDELAKLSQAIAQTEESIAKHERELAELHQHVADEEKAAAEQIAQLQANVGSQRGERERLADKVSRSLLRKYEHIRRLRGGVSVVVASGGVCTGCRMHIPAQLYNTLQRVDSIEQCPNCQRILYFAEARVSSGQEGP